jgi:hypothetical protein
MRGLTFAALESFGNTRDTKDTKDTKGSDRPNPRVELGVKMCQMRGSEKV